VSASFHIENFGCRAARADGEAVASRLAEAGLSARHVSEAEVIVVNTCSVTAEADRAARAYIRRAHRLNPAARILATGCYAQRAPAELSALLGVRAVIGNSYKASVPEIALELAAGRDRAPQFVSAATLIAGPDAPLLLADEHFAHSFLEEAQVVPGAQTRPSLKVQEGCGNHCSFCVIPQTRGGSRSLSAAAARRQVEGFIAAGGKELVFSGINLGRWGRDLGKVARVPNTLAELVREIFDQTGLARLRLSSIEPMDWDESLIDLMTRFGGTRLARHAHLPLQSGSDSVLRRMHRRYRPWHYVEKINALVRAGGCELTLGADVMVGFPGETDLEFQETVDLIRALPIGYLHLFPFSARPGTRAWALHQENPVSKSAMGERMAVLRTIACEKSLGHRRQLLGCSLPAITLHTRPAVGSANRTDALTENFIPVVLEGSLPPNQLIRIRAKSLTPQGELVGEIELENRGGRPAV
jgi:threonylcarbamoyladenosine tRNA methylthiotransferase MtaB